MFRFGTRSLRSCSPSTDLSFMWKKNRIRGYYTENICLNVRNTKGEEILSEDVQVHKTIVRDMNIFGALGITPIHQKLVQTFRAKSLPFKAHGWHHVGTTLVYIQLLQLYLLTLLLLSQHSTNRTTANTCMVSRTYFYISFTRTTYQLNVHSSGNLLYQIWNTTSDFYNPPPLPHHQFFSYLPYSRRRMINQNQGLFAASVGAGGERR